MTAETKECPFCAETIMAAAKKCRYCGEWLEGEGRKTAPGDTIGSGQVGGDKITVGDLSDVASVAVGRGAMTASTGDVAGMFVMVQGEVSLGMTKRDEQYFIALNWELQGRPRMRGFDLAERDLSMLSLAGADLRNAKLSGSDLTKANLQGADLDGADLDGAKLIRARYDEKTIWPADFDAVAEGAKEEKAAVLASVIQKVDRESPYYSCFVSYSNKNSKFARKFYKDLQAAGVKCWFAPEDMKIGEKLRDALEKAMLGHNKLLLILSQDSMQSDWVEYEVETAFENESYTGEIMLFPVRLDDSVFERRIGWPAHIRRTRLIGDFTDWEDMGSYQNSLQRVLRDLTIESGEDSG